MLCQPPSKLEWQHMPLRLSRLTVAIALLVGASGFALDQNAYALESISDQTMSDVTGADGIKINIGASQVSFGSLYWQDQIDNATPTPTSKFLTFSGATTTSSSSYTITTSNVNTTVVTPYSYTTPYTSGASTYTITTYYANTNQGGASTATPLTSTNTPTITAGTPTAAVAGTPTTTTPTTTTTTAPSAAVSFGNPIGSVGSKTINSPTVTTTSATTTTTTGTTTTAAPTTPTSQTLTNTSAPANANVTGTYNGFAYRSRRVVTYTYSNTYAGTTSTYSTTDTTPSTNKSAQSTIQTIAATTSSGVTITPTNPNGTFVTATINTGTNASGAPGLSLGLNIAPFTFSAPRLEICSTNTTAGCTNPSLGAVGLQTTADTQFSLVTSNGLLNQAGTAKVTLVLGGLNTYFTSGGNQIVGYNIRANISATGAIWVDSTDGFRFGAATTSGANGATVTLGAGNTLPYVAGIQGTLGIQAGSSNTLTNQQGLLQFGVSGGLYNTNLYLRGTGCSGTCLTPATSGLLLGDNLGAEVGASGIAMRLTAQLQPGAQNGLGTGSGFQLEFGGTGVAAGIGGSDGTHGYGIQMTNFVPFSNVTGGTYSTIDTGNVYLNLINTGTTTALTMPVQQYLNASATTSSNGAANNPASFPTSATNTPVNNFGLNSINSFSQSVGNGNLPANTDAALFAIRGLNIQGVPLQTYFYQNGVGAIGQAGGAPLPTGYTAVPNFALMPVLNNVNANLVLYSAPSQITVASPTPTSVLGYSLALSTTGNNGQTGETGTSASASTDVATTSLFLADTINNQYIGLRNINMFLQADGQIIIGTTAGVCGGAAGTYCLNITTPHFLLAMSAQIAAGYLPGAEPSGFATYSGTVAKPNLDVLDTINLKLEGVSGSSTTSDNITTTNGFSINTTSNGALGLSADLILRGTPTGTPGTTSGPDGTSVPGVGTSFLRIAEPTGAAIGLDNVTGYLQLGRGSQVDVGLLSIPTATGNNAVAIGGTFTSNLNINPNHEYGQELLATLNMYPSGGTAQPLGQMVITGGNLSSIVTIAPISR